MLSALFIISMFVCIGCGLYSDTLRSSLITGPDGGGVTRQNVYTGSVGKTNLSSVITAGAANSLQSIGWPYATMKLLYLVSDQDVTCSVNAASTGTPIKLIQLPAGVPFVWSNDVIAGGVVVDVQTLSSVSTPSGTFTLTLTFAGGLTVTTGAITYSGTIGTLQTNVRAAVYAVIGSANVTISTSGSTLLFTFGGGLLVGPQPLITVDNTGLSGGTMAMAHTTPGTGSPMVPNPFAANVTALYWSNPGASNANIVGEVIY